MGMHNPPHPGEFIWGIYLEPHNVSVLSLAESLGVSPSTLNRLVNGQSGISPGMALRLSKALGRSPESWLAMQYNYELWHARKNTDLSEVQKMKLNKLLRQTHLQVTRTWAQHRTSPLVKCYWARC